MNWTPCSKGTALVVLLVCSLAVAGTAGAISVTEEDAPSEAESNQRAEATVVIDDIFRNTTGTWDLAGTTELREGTVTWTVSVTDQDDPVDEQVFETRNFTKTLNESNEGDRVEITVSGEVPSPEGSYSYQPAQSFAIYDLNRIQGNSQYDITAETVHHYTNESQTARQAIDDARQTINDTGATGEPENLLNNSISAYENGNFGNAEDLAGQAKSAAQDEEESQQTRQMIMYGVAALVVIGLLTGGVLYWRKQQDDYGKLQ